MYCVVFGLCCLVVGLLLVYLRAAAITRGCKRRLEKTQRVARLAARRLLETTAELQLYRELFDEDQERFEKLADDHYGHLADQAALCVASTKLAAEHKAAETHLRQIIEAWKSYALGYEVLCEAVADNEGAGIENAQAVITSARETLRLLDEYDA
jgi:hypothetical protein